MTDYQPGDRIVKEAKSGTKTYIVADPVRTTRGKLRLITATGSIQTTWWEGRGGWLPPHYRWVRP